MDTLLKADIFFFITSVAVVVLTILVIIALIYFIKILKNVKDISETVRDGVDNASSHTEELLSKLTDNPLFRFMFGKKRGDKKKHKKTEDDK